MHCTNINHLQIQDWAKEFDKSPEYIGAIVSLWQESNNRLDEFPSKLWMENQIKSSNKENEIATQGQLVEEKPQGVPIKQGVSELFESNPELANSVYEALGFNDSIIKIPNKYELDKEYNLKSVLNNLLNAENESINNIYKVLLNSIPSDLKLIYSKNTRQNAAGEYIYLEDTIKINPNKLSHKTLIHEIIHALTHDALLKNKEFNSKITALRKKAVQYFEKNKPRAIQGSTKHALSSNDEFLAGIFNYKNLDFLNTLNNISSENTTLLEKVKNVFKDLINEIVSIAGIKINENSLLFEVINELGKIETSQITPQQKQQAQQLYQQYLESLNKPNTNPILQNNQQEQVKKFAELQERLNNKEFLEGAKNAYENSEGLKSFGTQEQYNDYIARVSLGIIKNPSSGEYNYTSKVKDIVYHGSLNKIESFDKSKLGSFTKAASAKEAIFFTDSIEVAKTYAVPKNLDETEKGRKLLEEFDINKITPEEDAEYGLVSMYKKQISEFEDDFDFDSVTFKRGLNKIKGWKTGTIYEYYSEIYPSILNIKNPKIKDFENKSHREESYFEIQIKAKEANNDGTILKNTFDGRERWGVFESNIYTVFEPEQIHILGSKADIQSFKEFAQGKQFQKLTAEEKAKTIEQVTKEHRSIVALKDLSAKLAWRIGGKVKFENKTDADWKGYNQGMTSVLNEAYMTPDTPFHEILAHPIIRAIKNKNVNSKLQIYEGSTFIQVREIDGKNWKSLGTFKTKEDAQTFIKNNSQSQLYQSLLKELETGRGKEVFEQVKRDYQYKKEIPYYTETISEGVGVYYNSQTKTGYEVDHSNGKKLQYFRNEQEVRDYLKINDKYTLEEQQEEAIVTLLGLMAADKLDVKKDATLISKLKELWKQISDFVKQLLLQDGIKIDELPITTTLNDLAEIMAYGNNKIILPGYGIRYYTPLNTGNKVDENNKRYYETLEEVNNEIKGLADANVEVDLSGVKVNTEDFIIPGYIRNFSNNGYYYRRLGDTWQKIKETDTGTEGDYENISLEETKIAYANEFTPRPDLTDINQFIEKDKEYEQSREIIEEYKEINNIQYDPEEVYSRGQEFYHIHNAYSRNNVDTELWVQNLLETIQDKAKIGAKVEMSFATAPKGEVGKGLQHHNKKTKQTVYITAYPKSEDIEFVSQIDNHTSSFTDLTVDMIKAFTNQKNERVGIALTKSVPLRNLHTIQPNLATAVDDVAHHNEIVIGLTPYNFRINYEEEVPYHLKKLIDNVNKILDDKYGKLVKPEIKLTNQKSVFLVYDEYGDDALNDIRIATFDTFEEAQKFADLKNSDEGYNDSYGGRYKVVKEKAGGKQPTQTKENTTSIESVKNKLDDGTFGIKSLTARLKYEQNKIKILQANIDTNQKVEESKKAIENVKKEISRLEELIKNPPQKEYTNQALTNLKVAALKEVARRYPRSLITSKVVPINPNMVDNSEIQYSKKQGYNPKTITDEYGNTWNGIKLTEKNKEKIFLNKSENKVNNSDKYFKDVIQPLIKTLSKKFPNIKVTIISENQLPENLKSKNINSYYKNNEVFIIKEKVTPEITIEEFLHPFVNVLKESNEELYKSLLKEAKQLFPELRADIKDSYKRVYDNKDDIDKEFLTQVLSKKVSQKQLTLFEQFKNWLKELLFGKNDNINLEELDINMKLGDVISMLSDNYVFNINDYSNEEFYSQSNDTTNNLSFIESLGKQSGIIDDSFKKADWSNEVNNLITQQYEFINPSFEQKRSCEKLMSFSNDLAGTTEKNYILKNNTSLDRASTILKQDERFKFNNDEFNEEKYENNRIWGNQIDDILRAVVLYRFNNDNGKIINEINLQREKRNEESLLSEEIVNKLIYEFNQFLKQNENKIALPQIFLYNENKKIGGTADLILVDKFGNCEIIDLKSSVNPTNFNGRYFENYIKTGENGNEYINRYDKAFNNEKASKKERHEAQLSLYAGCLEARAIPLNESKPLQILPIHILNNEDNYVNKINVEKIFSIQLNKEYLNKTNIDSEHNLRIQNNYETDFEYNVNTVILSIKNEIALLKHIKIENTEYSIKELEKMLKILENQNFINSNKLAIYIVELHKTFISGDINFQTKLNYLISDINNKKITDHNLIIEKLLNYKKKVNHFRPLINDLIKFYNEVNENNLNNNDPDSIFSKLIQINTVINQIDEKYEKIIIPFLAENFYQFTDTIPNKNIEQRLNRIQERIDEIKSEYNSKLKESNGQITKDIKKLKERFEKLEDELKIKKRILITTKEDIINQLKSGSNQDISMLERKFLSPQDSSNVFISGAAQIIDNNNNDLRQKLIEIQEKFLPSYREYAKTKEGLRNNPKEFNEGLFETITVGYFDVITKEFIERQELALVQEKDITKFNKEKQLFLESIKNITDKQEYFKKLNDWYLENTEAIQSKDIIIEGVVIKKGYLSIINSKLEDVNNRLITQKQFDTWYQNTFIIDKNNKITDIKISTKEGKELRQPSSKYTNQKWLDLQKGDISKLNYYNTLVSLLIESKNKYPLNISHEEKFILPQIDKKSYELLKENGIKEFGKDNLKRLFNERESDKKLNYGESTESSIKVIPIMFNDKIDLEKVSVDLAQSILLYSKEANYYESKVKLEPLMTALMLNLSKNTPKKIDSKGRLILKDFAKELNLPGLDKYINSSSNNIEALFKYYIDNMIYGISREKAVYNTPLGEVDMHSIVDTISAIMSHTSMGLPFGLFSNLSNYLQGTVQNSIEAHSEQFFEKSDLAWANKEYLSYSNDFVKNIVDEIPETFIGQLIEIIDPFIGEFKDQFGRKISKSKFRILINSSPFMFFQNIGEHNIQLTTMLALLKSTKLKDEQGKETNLYDIYKNSWNPETKKIEIKSNILSQLGSTTSNGLLSNAFKNKLNYILQSTHGNYAKQTAPEIKKDWFGRVFIFMRNFMATSIAKRWRGEVKNYSIMDMTEGYNRTFWRLMIEEFKEMKKVGFGFHTSKNGIFNSILKTDTSKLTPLELANLRRNAMDMAWVFATGLLSAILLGMYKAAGDDDEKSRIAMYLAPVMRLNSELSAFGQIGNPNKGFGFMPDIGDIKRGLMTPTVMYSYITKTFNFVEQIPKDITNLIFEGDIQRYENNSGYYDKGTSKLLADLLKLFGATPGKLDAKEAIKSLYLQQNR